MEDNKIKGIVKNLSNKTKGILLETPENLEGIWWNPLGDNVKAFIKPELKGCEVELTVVNQEHHTFSFITVVQENHIQEKENGNSKMITG